MNACGGLRRLHIPYDEGGIPKYWANEHTGFLSAIVEKFINSKDMQPDEVNIMRSYVLHWAHAPGFFYEGVDGLQPLYSDDCTVADIHQALDWLLDMGIDPL